MREVPVCATALEPYRRALGRERAERMCRTLETLASGLGSARIWNINSTAAGGGVAELLSTLAPVARAVGLDVRWLVIDGDAEFFAIAKRLCLRLYGIRGDDGALDGAAREHFLRTTAVNTGQLGDRILPGDVVIIHDPQPAGLIEAVRQAGATVIWRCHIGSDQQNQHTAEGWSFLRPWVEQADATVFSTPGHVPAWAPRPSVIQPSIDPCGPRNMPLSPQAAAAVLGGTGILAGSNVGPVTVPTKACGTVVRQRATVIREGPPPSPLTPMVVQVSRWDRLKDMTGVMRAFARAGGAGYLTLAGPQADGVADDPEAAEILDACRREWADLPAEHRRRIQLVCLPMSDITQNAVMVNALQRHAAVVVQKSLAEGFGLTVTEAMWKARPLLASAVGGIKDQVTAGEHGLLLADPCDLAAAADGIRRLLADRGLAARLGASARRRAADQFLLDRHLLEGARLIEDITGR